MVYTDDPLPSDSRFRTDLQELAKGDLETGAVEKDRMEKAQRADKKLRHASDAKHKRKTKH